MEQKELLKMLQALATLPVVQSFRLEWEPTHFEKPFQTTFLNPHKLPRDLGLPGTIYRLSIALDLP